MRKVYLLDTDILSDVIKNPDGAIARKPGMLTPDIICTSIIVAAELRFGAIRKNSQRLIQSVEDLLLSIDILPIDSLVDVTYGTLRAKLEKTGSFIGPNDLFIAAQALYLGLTLVTDNEREFRRVTGLSVENWLREES